MAESNNGICCEFIEYLKTRDEAANVAQTTIAPGDVNSFLTYCQLWQHKQCVCVFANDELIEKFHSLINEWITISIDVILHLVDDHTLESNSSLSSSANSARRWSLENKEKLLLAIVKIFSSNMPLYVTYKHLFSNNKDCCDTDTISLLQSYCQMHQQDNDMPIELLRNICNFIENNGMSAIKVCFNKATPDTLPITMAHVLFNIIFNIRIWLNPTVIMDHIAAMRPHVIKYMCQLSDKDLRLAGAKSTTELMYNSFKDAFDNNQYRIDVDGLTLSYKYFMCSTLTIRLCGIAQMNNQISLWNEYNSNSTNTSSNKFLNELAEWFIENRIIEHLFGPNLHVEVVKRSQDIMNFLAFTNQINEKHLDIIWAAAQLKHCSKPVLDMLLVLQKHLYPEALMYLKHLIYQMDLNSHTEQTFLLSATITKLLWSLMLNFDYERDKRDDKSALVFQPLIQNIFSSSDSDDEIAVPNRIAKRHESMETQPQSDDEDDDDEAENIKRIRKKKQEFEAKIKEKKARMRKSKLLESRANAATTAANSIMKLNPYLKKQQQQQQQEKKKGKNDDEYVIKYTDSEDDDDEEDDEEEEDEEEEEEDDDEEATSDEEILEISKNRKRVKKESELESDDEETATNMQRKNAEKLCEKLKKSPIQKPVSSMDFTAPLNAENQELVNVEMDTDAAATALHYNKSNIKCQQNNNDSSDVSGASPKNLNEFDDDEDKENQNYEEEGPAGASEQDVAGEEEEEEEEEDDDDDDEDEEGTKTDDDDDDDDDDEDEIRQLKLKRSSKSNSFVANNKVKIQRTSRSSTSSNSNRKLLSMNDICKEGNTFLWDIIQDEKSVLLNEKLVREAEKQLFTLVCYQTDKRIRIKFIEGCLSNLKNNRSAMVSIRLLTKLFSSFQSCRNAYNIEIYRVIEWSEEALSMMKIFFDNLKHFSAQYQSYKSQDSGISYSPTTTPPPSVLSAAAATTSSSIVAQSSKIFQNTIANLQSEIQVRLSFLAFVFSTMASPREFELTSEQVEQMWNCLIVFEEYQDDLFNWFLNQAKTKDYHAINIETFKLIFMNKIPLLDPNKFSQTALHLYQELFKIYKYSYYHTSVTSSNNTAMSAQQFKQLEATCLEYISKLAFRSANNEVSVSAIQFLNMHYIQSDTISKELEQEFIKRCMFYLNEACSNLETDTNTSLVVLQRGLLLLKNHIDLFQKRFSYQLRVWCNNGMGVISHAKALQDCSQVQMVGLVCQIDVLNNYKIPFKVNINDYIGDLKAVIRESIIQDLKSKQFSNVDLMRLIENEDDYLFKYLINGQELTNVMDCRQVSELQLKETQVIHVTIISLNHHKSSSRSSSSSSSSNSSGENLYETMSDSKRKVNGQTRLTHEVSPMVILANEPYFSNLFHILNKISKFKRPDDNLSIEILASKAWDIIMLLPTNRNLLNIFTEPERINLLETNVTNADGFLSTEIQASKSSYLLLYYLQIIEIISKYTDDAAGITIASSLINSSYYNVNYKELLHGNNWKEKFIEMNCLNQLYCLFVKQMKHAFENNKWNEAFLDCLHIILKLLVYYLIDNSRVATATVADQRSNDVLVETPRKKTKRNNNQSSSSSSISSMSDSATIRITVSTLTRNSENQAILFTLIQSDINLFLNLIFNLQSIISSADYVYLTNKNLIKIEILYYSMQLLFSCLITTNETIPAVHHVFASADLTQQRAQWLKALLLDCNEALFRKEVCGWLYKLATVSINRASTSIESQPVPANNQNNILAVLLSDLLSLLCIAVKFSPNVSYSRNKKELLNSLAINAFVSTCKDYFFLITALIQNLNSFSELLLVSNENSNRMANVEHLTKFIAVKLKERDFYEKNYNNDEDEVLIGLLNLGIAVMKHNPNYKTTAKSFIDDLYGYLFDLPTADRRYLPKCKSSNSRTLCFDLLIELVRDNIENYKYLHGLLVAQHTSKSHAPYAWEYWPRDDVRSSCGYVGLTNLGATCYMATSLQHLYMINDARQKILNANISVDGKRYESMLSELQKMFAYLLESERKAYSPKNFCKVYTMDNQPLNTTEQKDMTEFFTDLISKIEEMSPELKQLVKSLFGGTITNLVISLDCPHVSCMLEEFYTVRCQVAGMKDLYDSLNEITVKDTLEGDNMYTCSKCGKKVRAEKRACFRKLPKILCFNTMRYTFNMVTMLKEKVNTHFSFPLKLDMSGYMEKNLISPDKLNSELITTSTRSQEPPEEESYTYELIGVTVHTGTAEGGHYYSFIRDRTSKDEFDQDRWYLFNDAEVKPFDPKQIGSECFGGETTSKTYDSAADRFLDLSFEKTHSAYMLFYERIPLASAEQRATATDEKIDEDVSTASDEAVSSELINWIWEDNMKFIQDRNTFEHSYFNFIWQMCDYIPRMFNNKQSPAVAAATASPTMTCCDDDMSLLATQLGCSFILETYIHAKEKPTMLQWIELLTKYLNANRQACKWFIEYMCNDLCWAAKVFLRCPNSTIRQMFQRLLLHVINRVNNNSADKDMGNIDSDDRQLIERFIHKMLELIDFSNQTVNISKYNIRHMSEYFMFLHEFVRLGSEECKMLVKCGAISKCIQFYLLKRLKSTPNLSSLMSTNQSSSNAENQPTTSSKANNEEPQQQQHILLSSGSEDEASDIIPLQDQKSKIKVFEKIIALISILIEHSSMTNEQKIVLLKEDRDLLVGERDELTFIYKSILDDINLHYVRNIICSIIRHEPVIAVKLVDMITNSVKRMHNDNCAPFFNILGNNTMGLLEYECNDELANAQLVDFTELIVDKLATLIESAPYHALQWLSTLVFCNVRIHRWCLDNIKLWCKHYLIAHKQTNVRFSAAVLLANMVPNKAFRDTYPSNRNLYSPFKPPTHHCDIEQKLILNYDFNSNDCKTVLHKIIEHLFSFIGDIANYVDKDQHAHNTRLVQYFAFLIFTLAGKDEKLLFTPYVQNFWQSFFPIISNIHTVANLNKQAALHFFYQVLLQCDENIDALLGKIKIERELPLVTIAIDHEDSELITYNRNCLHIYYGIIRLCCQHSTDYTRQMSLHNNFMWAFKYILPYSIQYPLAVQELNKCIILFVDKTNVQPGDTEANKAINALKDNLFNVIFHDIDPKTCWQSIILVLKSLVETQNDAHIAIFRKGLSTLTLAFQSMCIMHHEATACNLTSDLMECMNLLEILLKAALNLFELQCESVKQVLIMWKEKHELWKRLVLLLNFYNSIELRNKAIELLRVMTNLAPSETIVGILHSLTNYYTQSNQFSVYPCQLYNNQSNSNTSMSKIFENASSSAFSRTQQPSHQLQNFMGPYFPTSKLVLNKQQQQQFSEHLDHYHHYTVPASSTTSCLASVRPSKPIFNLFLKLSHIAHTHLNGNVFIMDKEYEAQLNENFLPYFNLIDNLVRLAFKYEISISRELINLMIIIAQQALLLNLSSIPFILEQLDVVVSPKIGEQVSLVHENLRKYVFESQYTLGFVQTILYDYRHVLNKRDIYRFMQFVFTCEYLLGKLDIKMILEETMKSIKDLRDAFETFVSKILSPGDETAMSVFMTSAQLQQYEFKISVLFGNTVIVYFILSFCSLSDSQSQIIKTLMQIHEFFCSKVTEIRQHLAAQQQPADVPAASANNDDDNADQQAKKPKYEQQQELEHYRKQFLEALLQKLSPAVDYMNNSINYLTTATASNATSTTATTSQQSEEQTTADDSKTDSSST